jgi:murein DD-endopeptidase MepM/ murein hydrolase activator NlpD
MKKFLFTISLLLLTCTSLQASTEGKIFLPVNTNNNFLNIPLEKISKKEIQSRNIQKAFLFLQTSQNYENILLKDTGLEKEYILNQENGFFDITNILKRNVEKEKSFLEIELDEIEFCFEKCQADQYPFVKVEYSFNNPPNVNLLQPLDGVVFENGDITLTWQGKDNDGRFLEFMLEIFHEGLPFFQSTWARETSYDISLGNGAYQWRVTARDNSKLENFTISEFNGFEINMPVEEEEENEEIEEEEIVEEEREEEIQEEKKEETVVNEDILGIGGVNHGIKFMPIPNPSLCRYKYNRTYKRFERRQCNIPRPNIIDVNHTTTDGKNFQIDVSGNYNPNIVILIDVYECQFKMLCMERFVGTYRANFSPYTTVLSYINGSFRRTHEFRKGSQYFFTSKILSNQNLENRKISLKYNLNHSFRFNNHWVNINLDSAPSEEKNIPKPTRIQNTSKPFRSPFSKIVGVTQWHGYTAFQSPHTGIDFGSYREPIYAIADGNIQEAQWDNYAGKCLTGGYFLRIAHDNGMNSVYLHLENFKKSNGQNWKVGERVRKNELIGITGNSGYYNCQPLGYHLHFELRKDRLQANHINPVPYVDINWDSTPTIQHQKYPGRLTGNNPHPTW